MGPPGQRTARVIQPSECLHGRWAVEAEYPPRFKYCLDCGTQEPLPDDHEQKRMAALKQRFLLSRERRLMQQEADAGAGYARLGKRFKK